MSDLIDRQQAIDALRTCYDTETITMDNGDEYINYGDAVGEIEQLPSAEPEIICCKDCKHWDTTWQNDYAPNYHYCPMIDGTRRNDFYCAYAERKEVNNESD